MVALVALIIWRLHPIIVLFGFLVFASLDGVYLSSVLIKVPQGAWFTLAIACLLSSVFILWRYGKENQWRAEASDRFHPSHLVTKAGDNKLVLTPAFGGGEITHIKGFGIFFDKAGDMTPTVFIQFLSKFVATPDISVFFHLRPLSTPSVPPENRYTVLRTVIPNCYRLIIRHGYTDEVVTEDLGGLIYEKLRAFISSPSSTTNPSNLSNPNPESLASSSSSENSAGIETAVGERLRALEKAYETQVLYIVGKEQMRIKQGTGFVRRVMLSAFLWLRENTRSKMAAMKIPTGSLVELGFVKEV
jgi:KUP system potassium uptake protein